MMDSLLTEYQHPANPKNAARAGWEAARRWLSRHPAPAVRDERGHLTRGQDCPRHGITNCLACIRRPSLSEPAVAAAQPTVVSSGAESDVPAWFGVQDEVALTRAVCVMNDVLGDISGWEDKALSEAIESSKVDLCAMIECIRMGADDTYVPGSKPIDGELPLALSTASTAPAHPASVQREPLSAEQIRSCEWALSAEKQYEEWTGYEILRVEGVEEFVRALEKVQGIFPKEKQA